MTTLTDVLNPDRILSSTTKRVVSTIDGVIEQSFNIKAYGLLINTEMNLYVNGKKANTASLVLRDRPGNTFSTDSAGEIDFIFYYRESLSELTGLSETKFQEYLDRNTGNVILNLVDKASVDSNTVSNTAFATARCTAVATIARSYNPLKTQISEVFIKETDTTRPPVTVLPVISNNVIASNNIISSSGNQKSNTALNTSITGERTGTTNGTFSTVASGVTNPSLGIFGKYSQPIQPGPVVYKDFLGRTIVLDNAPPKRIITA